MPARWRVDGAVFSRPDQCLLSGSLLPSFAGQLLTRAIPVVSQLRSSSSSATTLLPSFSRFLGGSPFSNFRFSLTDSELSGVLRQLTTQQRLPAFFLR